MEITAHARYLRISPRKVRKMADLVRAQNANAATTQLAHVPHRSARPLKKLIESALHSAKNNFGIDASELYIKKITVDAGPVGKRFRPGAAGRTNPYAKRTSHVTLILNDRGGAKAAPRITKRADDARVESAHNKEAAVSAETRSAKRTGRFEKSDERAVTQRQSRVRRIFQRKAMGS